MLNPFLELTIVIAVAAVLGVVLKVLRQPTIVAYMGAGFALGALGFLQGGDLFNLFADLGIVMLLFLIGLEINYASLHLVGRASVIIGIWQVVVTAGLAFLIAYFMGWPLLTAGYIAAALSFSSTVIVVKFLSERHDLGSLFGRLDIGILLLQDFIAILILILLEGVQNGAGVDLPVLGAMVLKGVLLLVGVLVIGRVVLPLVFDKVSQSSELLFISSMAWMLAVVAFVKNLGFSIEIGGFLAGLALANSSENFKIANRIRPLRDFFLMITFVMLGRTLAVSPVAGLWLPIAVFTLFALIIKPLVIQAVMGFLGYRKRTGFMTAVMLAQLSEFSLVLAVLGFRLGHIDQQILAVITATAVLSIIISSYLSLHANAVYRRLRPFFALFERSHVTETAIPSGKLTAPVIIIGYHRTGISIGESINKRDLLVIDFDPEVARFLKAKKIRYVFADSSDPELYSIVDFKKASLVISTTPDLEDNLLLLSRLNRRGSQPKIIVRADRERDARALYDQGADYVLVPHVASGHYLGQLIADNPNLKFLERLRKADHNGFHDSLFANQSHT